MGIKNLNKLLIEHECIKYHNSLQSFRKTKQNYKKLIIAIDTNLYYYKYLKSSLKNPFHGFLLQITNFLKNNIIPIYILDGKSPLEKKFLIKKRRLNNSVYVPYNEIKSFFDILNIKYIHIDEEADKTIGILYQKNIIHYCLTDDLDILLYKCKNIISFKKGIITEYNLEIILEKLNLSYPKFIYMCILLGCDYIKPKLNIPYNYILNLIKIHSIDNCKNILLLNYDNYEKKINFIYTIIHNVYNIFFYDINNYNIKINLNKKKYYENVSYIIKDLKSLNNDLINKLPYQLIYSIYKKLLDQ